MIRIRFFSALFSSVLVLTLAGCADDSGTTEPVNDMVGDNADTAVDTNPGDTTPDTTTLCGNGVIDAGEMCDGMAFDTTCEDLGFAGGTLSCSSDCARVSQSTCDAGPDCGNGAIDGTEECDDGAANSDTAPDACRTNCRAAACGDGVQDTAEGCDSGDMNSDTTANACRTTCQPAGCGDGVIDSAEECDGTALGMATCSSLGATGGTLACANDCSLDQSQCTTCGDGTAEGTDPMAPGYEACDGTDFRMQTCRLEGFEWGPLACDMGCNVDTSGCSSVPAVCGNNATEDMEVCDGTDLSGQDCTTLGMGFTGGTLGCQTGCGAFDTSACYTCGNGMIEGAEVCDDGNTVSDLTCAADCLEVCGVGVGQCSAGSSTFCDFDSQGVVRVQTEVCDSIQGSTCDSGTGRCVGVCSLQQLGQSYIGCEYYPTITNNALLSNNAFFFAITVANSGAATANVTVTQGATTVTTTTVPAGDIATIALPWNALKTAGTTMLADGAYRVRTDQPVTVYQYNPLDYQIGGAFSYTNDASLLLPTNTWADDYFVVSRNFWSYSAFRYPGLYAVVAREDNTTVTLTPSATGGIVNAGAGVAANGTGTVVLNEGDVLQVTARSGGGSPDISDLTGTRVVSDKPIQVIGGHQCTNVPNNTTACDHLEEAIPPLRTVGTEYLATTPLIGATTTKARMVRIVATAPNTTLTYDPPQAGAPTALAAAGDFVEIASTSADFRIAANEKILVAQYMLGQSAGGGTGDPAMVLAVPVGQYRTDYLFHAPVNYQSNFVNITAPTGTTVTLDGAVVTGFTTVGTTGFDVARVQLSNAGNGNHTITAPQPFGISVYGYGQYTSYWYPGGLDLNDL